MKKSYRVKSEIEFQRVFDQKNSIANKYFIIYQFKRSQNKHFRVGISVGKKIGNAVNRNFVKRRIRQVIYQFSSSLKSDVDFIIIARPEVNVLEFDEFKKNLKHVLRIANLFEDDINEKKD
ncbi:MULTISPECIES: ribonuclease P protein component [unclassified Enterococcus]|uniref:ribonuclease P protein component n=1 Tax=unclassified Enterococcus TaxID=2608891 RepID=UPI001554E466|nr:ribonuclease P protein component [Enterococcus sp. MMGLQ5-2]MBS7583145.1 ribonuclease P protein component [Enterococcus sp. MMGLQ5-1]NPD11005.1 ribonuclease P protein component [Enterococcus sp. MMGLQ5-1]NPD35748.1 ribonuclease P protein component [Enterococcus sp. MMGLQ5-2]